MTQISNILVIFKNSEIIQDNSRNFHGHERPDNPRSRSIKKSHTSKWIIRETSHLLKNNTNFYLVLILASSSSARSLFKTQQIPIKTFAYSNSVGTVKTSKLGSSWTWGWTRKLWTTWTCARGEPTNGRGSNNGTQSLIAESICLSSHKMSFDVYCFLKEDKCDPQKPYFYSSLRTSANEKPAFEESDYVQLQAAAEQYCKTLRAG